jgi:sterol-4alpha-carboxylate 3-dehydrogenase (decarboxylating)
MSVASASDIPHTDASASELRELLEEYVRDNWTGRGKTENAAKMAAVFAVGMFATALGAFAVLVPITYGIGGFVLHSKHKWSFFQPGVGGARFVALNGLGWALYAISLVMSGLNFALHDTILSFMAFAVGMLSYGLVVSSLLVYQNKDAMPTTRRAQVTTPSDEAIKRIAQDDRTFTEDFELSALMHSGEGPSDLWWLFVAMNTVLAGVGAWVGLLGDFHAKGSILKIGSIITVLWTVAASAAITHAIGGQWKHINTGYIAFQPGKGGPKYVALQALGWMLFSIGELLGLLVFFSESSKLTGGKGFLPGALPLSTLSGLLGLVSQVIIAGSLFFYIGDPSDASKPQPASVSAVIKFLRATQFLGLNIIFSGGSSYETARKVTLKPNDYEAWKHGEEKFLRLCSEAKAECTGEQYLIIGVGFVGKRLVQRLLQRGETKIRLFDIVPTNPFPGDSRIEYVRGDVTKYDQVLAACQGVQCVYSTFAIIRFMDRLEHQAALSYRINVGGTENVLKACAEANVDRIIVTSSSHATTDEHSLPRHNRNESAPYVTKETAHNHYGWTKAIADIMCVKAANTPRADGQPIKIAIVRPCSGVFGGDDRISFEKAMDLTIFPGVAAKMTMDWIYVENVVLGHLLVEAALKHDGKVFGKSVNGEAFNVSNNEAVKNEDMWFSVMRIMRECCEPSKVKSNLELVYVPEAPLWGLAYLSELNQKIFKGKVSLGRDLDTMTPGMMATACMDYSYNSDKAKEYLGYEAAYSLDEAIQKSLYDYWENHYGGEKKVQ